MSDVSKYTVRELFDFVRRGMIWRGKAIEPKLDRYTTARMWVKEEDITPGIYAVKSAAMYDNYNNWCKQRGLTGKSVLSSNKFGEIMSELFKFVNYGHIRHYYVNKDLKEDEEAKKARKALDQKRKAKKDKPSEETTG